MKTQRLTFCFFLLSFFLTARAQTLSFTDVAQQVGVADTQPGSGAAWGDYDGDGDPDLYVVNLGVAVTGPQIVNRLYRNDVNINGMFVDVAPQMGVAEIFPSSRGAAWCDFNSDGNLDLYVCNYSWDYPDSNKLFLNNGNFFLDVASQYNIANWGENFACSWGDYDNDGDPDLYVCVQNYPGGKNKLFRNDGLFFTDVTQIYNIQGGRNSSSSNWIDFDNDGDLDLYVYNNYSANNLYENKIDENNKFVDVANFYSVDDPGGLGGSTWFDFDNDGDFDLLLINWSDEYHNSFIRLYRNNINFTNKFIDVTATVGIVDTFYAVCGTTGDFDQDGDEDLYIGTFFGENKYYRNDFNTNGFFIECGDQYGLSDSTSSVSLITGDYERDGDLDIYLTTRARRNNRIYRNNLNSNSYFKITIKDKNGNLTRMGSIVKIYQAGTDSLIGMRMVDGGGSGGRAQNGYDCHFGLDPNQAYDIEVIFTTRTNGQNHVFNKHNRPELCNVIPAQVGHFLEIRDTVITVTTLQPREKPQTINRFKLYQNYPNPFNSNTIIPFQIEKTYKVKITIYDLTGKEVITLTDSPYQRGFYEIRWNGKNNEGGDVASGAYICHFFLDNKLQDVKKLLLIR